MNSTTEAENERQAENERKWLRQINKVLLDRRIVKIRYMSKKEAEEMEWERRSIVLELDDGNIIYPSMDDGGNDGGALLTNDEELSVIPVF